MNGRQLTARDSLQTIRRDNLEGRLVDISRFSPHTSSCLRSFETDLIILLPIKLHPPCIINHRIARFAERQFESRVLRNDNLALYIRQAQATPMSGTFLAYCGARIILYVVQSIVG